MWTKTQISFIIKLVHFEHSPSSCVSIPSSPAASWNLVHGFCPFFHLTLSLSFNKCLLTTQSFSSKGFNEILAALLRHCLLCSTLEVHSIIKEVYINNRAKYLSVEQKHLRIVTELNRWGVSNLTPSADNSPFCPLQCFLDNIRSYTDDFSLCLGLCAQFTYLHYLLIPTANPELHFSVLTWWNRSKERFNSFKPCSYQIIYIWIWQDTFIWKQCYPQNLIKQPGEFISYLNEKGRLNVRLGLLQSCNDLWPRVLSFFFPLSPTPWVHPKKRKSLLVVAPYTMISWFLYKAKSLFCLQMKTDFRLMPWLQTLNKYCFKENGILESSISGNPSGFLWYTKWCMSFWTQC